MSLVEHIKSKMYSLKSPVAKIKNLMDEFTDNPIKLKSLKKELNKYKNINDIYSMMEDNIEKEYQKTNISKIYRLVAGIRIMQKGNEDLVNLGYIKHQIKWELSLKTRNDVILDHWFRKFLNMNCIVDISNLIDMFFKNIILAKNEQWDKVESSAQILLESKSWLLDNKIIATSTPSTSDNYKRLLFGTIEANKGSIYCWKMKIIDKNGVIKFGVNGYSHSNNIMSDIEFSHKCRENDIVYVKLDFKTNVLVIGKEGVGPMIAENVDPNKPYRLIVIFQHSIWSTGKPNSICSKIELISYHSYS